MHLLRCIFKNVTVYVYLKLTSISAFYTQNCTLKLLTFNVTLKKTCIKVTTASKFGLPITDG